MKNYFNKFKSLALAGVATLSLASCGDFLYIEPKTFVSEDNFWNERADIDQMVAGVYVKMQNSDFLTRCIVWGEVRSDNVADGKGAADNLDLYRTLKEDLKSNNAYTDWSSFYAVIGQCNIIIERAPQVSEKDPTYTQSDVMATKAEMAALRDLCYYYLVRTFKDVPYYTHAIQSDADITPMPAVDGDMIVRNCINDLDTLARYALKAYPDDNTSKYNSSRNRITQNAIYALLADMCLWDGQYQRAADYCQAIIDAKYDEYQEDFSNSTSTRNGSLAIYHNENDIYSYGYPLYPCFQDKEYGNDYNQIFGGDGCSFESIFELAFTYDGSNDQYAESGPLGSFYGSHKSGSNEGKGLLAVTEKVRTDVYNATYKVFDHKLDARYFTNIRPDDTEYTAAYVAKLVNERTTVEQTTTNPYYAMTKSSQGDSYNNRNWMFYRLTDVMLMQAEALIELGRITEGELDDGTTISELDDNLKKAFYLIWTVNRRSIMTNSATSTHTSELKITNYKTIDDLRQLCLKERQRELMFEGKRWFDLVRMCHKTHTTDEVLRNVQAKISSGATKSLFLNYESLFWPYNKTEVRNNDALPQKSYYGNDDDEDNFQLSTKD